MEILKEDHYPVRFAVPEEGALANLRTLERTGWVQRGIEKPETVYDHTLALRALAIQLKSGLDVSEAEFQDLLGMLEVHDWPEAIVGDLVILGDEADRNELLRDKQQQEEAAMIALCADRDDGEQALEYFRRFEAKADRIAQLANQLDKLQAVLQAEIYEFEQDPPLEPSMAGLTAEFYQYTDSAITDPYLRTVFEAIKDRRNLSADLAEDK